MQDSPRANRLGLQRTCLNEFQEIVDPTAWDYVHLQNQALRNLLLVTSPWCFSLSRSPVLTTQIVHYYIWVFPAANFLHYGNLLFHVFQHVSLTMFKGPKAVTRSAQKKSALPCHPMNGMQRIPMLRLSRSEPPGHLKLVLIIQGPVIICFTKPFTIVIPSGKLT